MVNQEALFECERINQTTFVIVENDKYEEHPFIYVKIYDDPPLVVLSDTGCGSIFRTSEEIRTLDLRKFIETSPIPSNHDRPLNPCIRDGQPSKKYLIICTHCHYDHILGLPCFQDDSHVILASSHDRSFIEKNLPEHSLCKYIGVPVPKYAVSYWAKDCQIISLDDRTLHLKILHTPGHTPDSLAWYDETERHLYVGDSFYERVAEDKSYEQAILFPGDGRITEYMKTLDKLLAFIEHENALEPNKPAVKIGSGHVTASTDGKEMIREVKKLFIDIIAGSVPIVKSEQKRGEEFVHWREEGEPRFSVAAPMRLISEARKARG